MDLNVTTTRQAGEVATLAQQQVYWGTSFAITTVALISLIFLFIESRKNEAFKTPILKSFGVLLLGDFAFTICYLPYHAYNTINLLLGSEFTDPGESSICLVSWFFASTAFSFELWGFVYLGYVPYSMIRDSRLLRSNNSSKDSAFYVMIAVAITVNCIWFTVGYVNGQLGSMRGLYCAASTWNNSQGIIVFCMIAVTLSMFAFYFFLTFQGVKVIEKTSANGDIPSNGAGVSQSRKGRSKKKSLRAILKFGMFMFANFCISYGVFAITTFWNTFSPYFGSIPPIELEMVAGLGTKTKAIIDVITILYIPSVRKARRKRKGKVITGTSGANSSSVLSATTSHN